MNGSGSSSASAVILDSMTALQDRLSVALIATPRDKLLTCRAEDSLSTVVSNNLEKYDYFPVLDGAADEGGQIIGLLELAPYFNDENPPGIVHEKMIPVSENFLIGANAGILGFLRTADHNGCRLVVSGAKINGLVNLSDLQKLPVRAALFALIIRFEMTMAEAIGRELDNPEEWKNRLSPRRRAEIENRRKKAVADNNEMDELLLTDFNDKRNIILKSPLLPLEWRKFDSDSNEARKLRNNLVHANEYAATRKAATKVCDTVRKIEHWIALLRAWPSTQASGGE